MGDPNKIERVADGALGSIYDSRAGSAIFLIVCSLPLLSTLLFGGVDNTTWVLISILWLLIIFFWIIGAWQSGEIVLSRHQIQIPLLGILFIGLIQLLPFGPGGETAGLLPLSASNSISLDPGATRLFLSRLAVYIVFFAACLTFIQSEKRLRKITAMVILFGSMMAFLAILLRLANPDGIYGIRETPQAVPFGPFVNQHHFASFMQMTGGVTLSLLLGKSVSRDKKALLVIALVLMSVAAMLTGSRGGALGMIGMAFLVVLLTVASRGVRGGPPASASADRGRSVTASIATGAALLLFTLGALLFVGGEESLLRGIGMTIPSDDVSSGRTHFWAIALRMFADYPIFGVGFDAFGVAFTKYDTWSGLFRVEQAHNEYLQVLAEGGIPAILCLTAFIYFLFRSSLRTVWGASGIVRSASMGALAGCFGILVHSFFDFPLRTPSNGFFFLLLCAIAVYPVTGEKRL